MIEQLAAMPKYEAYKDSGVEWLGEIPAHWELSKLGSCLKPVSVKNRSDLPLLSITREKGVIQRNIEDPDENHNYIPDDLSNYKVLECGQFGMNKMKAWQGSYGVSDHTGIVSPAYFIFAFTKEIDSKFFHLAIRSGLYISYFGSASDGVRIGQWDLSKPRMKEIPFLIPPIPEQTIIATFLDQKTAQIDQAVAIKERQIALLKERKQILIQNAVTRGLNPDAPMRDSGVEWIGEIPQHWRCSRLKMHSKIQSGITLGKSYPQKNLVEMPYIRVANVQNGYFKLDDIATISVPKSEIPRYLLQNHDILVTEGGDIDKLGRGTVWRDEIKPCLHQNHVFAIRVNQSILSQDFVSNFLATDMVRKYFIDTATKTTNLASTNRTHLGNLYLPVPSLIEQAAIVAHIETESAKIDQAISIQQQQIDKLKEYKASLINSAVTGKIKVPALSN
ncbi:MAG: restriction endonuclease subunit S [Methylobacter sp.]|jgi:type I restriction enzyme S subunit|nr:restriction endonuclease subunit S [Methylobacter sp.]